MLTPRQKALLKKILDSFIKDAQPVASGLLVNQMKEPISPATVRNELVTLEKQGYIFQPHTSAGRVPTAKAYQFYVDNYLEKNRELTDKEEEILSELKNQKGDDRLRIKNFAKAIAQLSKQGVMVTFSECDNYYTGISNLFRQPEFNDDPESVVNLSAVVDCMDKKLAGLLRKQHPEPEILIGRKNPIGQECGLVVFDYQIGKYRGIIGLLGPMRMEYQRNYTLLKKGVKLLK